LTIENNSSTNVTPRQPNDLALMRTILAADRTLMAWVRTSFTLLGFGFTIYAILKALQDAGNALPNENTPRNIGLFLSVMGICSILLGTVDYWMTLRELRKIETFRYVRPALIMALVMSAFGLFLFFGIVAKLF
jgi:putative membrane protein